jgi:hypothetical protein
MIYLAIASTIAVVYGTSWLALEPGLDWFMEDTRAKLPHRLDRVIVQGVILAIAPILLAVKVGKIARGFVHHQRVSRAIRRLPHQTDPEQQHIVDELKNKRFYDAAHHPTGHIGGPR